MDTEFPDRKPRTVSTKLRPEELGKLDDLALERGETRGYLIKELIQAGLEGRAILPLPPSIRGSIRDFGASEAGRAAIRQARDAAEAALDAGPAAPEAGKNDA
jgi:predicted transcriptional regulator